MSLDDWLEVGKIVAPQGLNGEVRIYPESDFPERFLTAGPRWMRKDLQDAPREVQLIAGRHVESKKLYIVKFKGINDRQSAEAIRGHKLLVKAADRPPLEPGEFYLMDLIGLTVIHHQTKEKIGTVVRIAAAGNDLLEVQLCNHPDTTVFIPFVSAFFSNIDLAQQSLELQPILGLLPETDERVVKSKD